MRVCVFVCLRTKNRNNVLKYVPWSYSGSWSFH